MTCSTSYKRQRRSTGFRRGLVVIAVLASASLASISSSNEAGAYCSEWGYNLELSTTWGAETAQYSSTCDWDNIYKSKVKDSKTDGYCVEVQVATQWAGPWVALTAQCNLSWKHFTAWTTTYDLIRICKLGGGGCTYAEWNHSA